MKIILFFIEIDIIMSYNCSQCGYSHEPDIITWPSDRLLCSICGMQEHYLVYNSEVSQQIQERADQKVLELDEKIRKRNDVTIKNCTGGMRGSSLCNDVIHRIVGFNVESLITKF